MSAMSAQSRSPTTRGSSFFDPSSSVTVPETLMLSRSTRASSADKTGVLPFFVV